MVKIIEAEGIALNGDDSLPLTIDYNLSFFKRRKALKKEKERRELIRYHIADVNKRSKIRTRKKRRHQFFVKFKDSAIRGIVGGTFKAALIFIFGLLIEQ